MKIGIKKLLSLLIVAACVLTCISGCSGSTTSGGKKYLFCTYNLDGFRTAIMESIKAAAQSEGATLEVYVGEETPSDQVNRIKKAKSEGFSALIVNPIDVSTALQLEVAAEGLPIVFVNNKPDDSVLKSNKYIYAGSNETEAGELQAEWALKKLGNPASMNVVIFKGEQGHSGTIGRTKAVKYTLKDAGVEANYVFADYAIWSDEVAEKKMKTFLLTGQKYDVVFCNNDTMALGVVKALKEAGIDPADVPVCGVDATDDGCASIANGEMSFTVFQNAKGQGEAAMKAALKLAAGESITSLDGATKNGLYVWVPFEPVDASNVNSYK